MSNTRKSLKYLVFKSIVIYFGLPVIGSLLVLKILIYYNYSNANNNLVLWCLCFSTLLLFVLFIVFNFLFKKKILPPLNSFINAIEEFDFNSPHYDVGNIITESNEFSRLKEAIISSGERLKVKKIEIDSRLNNDEKELKAKEQEVKALISQLKEAQVALITEEKMSSAKVIISSVSHELKNPINIAINSTKVLRDIYLDYIDGGRKRKDEKILKMFDQVVKNHEKMVNIIDTMLLSNKQDKSKIEDIYIKKKIDMSYKEVISVLNMDEYNIKYENHLKPDLKMKGYSLELNRLFINLFQNSLYALKKKAENNIQFEPKIIISSSTADKFCSISIRDNGIGIKEEHLEKIMVPFFTTKPSGEGVGLGLHLIKEVVKLHNASLQIQSKYEEFTEIIIKVEKS